ncbi:MAG: hypothetical protein WAO76_15625 [Georgfuchsia sp.]
MSDRGFAAKIAAFNAIGSMISLACVTYLDPLLTAHIQHGAVVHPYGYPVAAIGGLVIFVSTYLALAKGLSWKHKIWLPSGILLLVDALSLPFFLPEFPNGGIAVWTLELAVCSMVTCVIRYVPFNENVWLSDSEIAESARIERVKEFTSLWRTVAVSSMFGFLALLVPWTDTVWKFPENIVRNRGEAFLLGQYGGLDIVVVCFYALLGVVYEAFHKSEKAAHMLLSIRSQTKSG